MNSEVALCAWEGPQYLLFSEGVPAFVYYSHIPVFVVALFLAIFILVRSRKELPARILVFTIIPFALWVLFDQIFWASNRSDVIMFVWSAIILVEPLIHGGIFYLQYVLVRGQDLPFSYKLAIGALFLPLIVFVPTAYTLSAFDIGTCLAVESFFGLYYSYAVELILILAICVTGIRGYIQAPSQARRLEITYLTIGILAFLLLFTAGNLLGSFTSNWQVGQLGLLGMPIFIAMLAYIIVRFKTFQIQVIGAQALVVSVWFLLLASLFVRTEGNIRIINFATFILFTLLGYQLMQSVRREVSQRKQIETLVVDLERANMRLRELDRMKSEFVSIASHQMRSPLTSIRGYAEAVLDGTFGTISEKIKEVNEHVRDSSYIMLKAVDDFLNISRIEQGKLDYSMATFDICSMLRDVVAEQEQIAKRRHLDLLLELPEDGVCNLYADATKVKQIFDNILDNAIKYTPDGKITVRFTRDTEAGVVRVAIADTGIGLTEDGKRNLFKKFNRAVNAKKLNTGGTGLGLYVAKQMISAHQGRIWAESGGEGRGSTFYVEFPLHK
ncbi:MAG TPA: HAMP domain-containing sensor histidine kinase [Candidatus Paceibacterota bacterium]|jgi:signal transduction histidine kinase